MTVTLVVPDRITRDLIAATRRDVESAGVLLARPVETPDGNLRLLARDMIWCDDDAYLLRDAQELRIASQGYVPALAQAEADGSIAVWLHTHPGDGSSPKPSHHDEVVDEQLADLFRLRAGCEFYAALVVASSEGQLNFAGHVATATQRFDIDRVWVTGRRLGLVPNALIAPAAVDERFDRNVRAFGGHIQRVLGDLTVAVVGAGGTGSAVSEQLVRLGVHKLHVFDNDTLTDSNVTRVYGSYAESVGQLKVVALADHLRRISPDCVVTTHDGMITSEPVARRLLDADVVFGCTDDNAGRLVLSRLSTYTLTPVIDCGVLLSSSEDGELTGIDGRVTVLAPDAACLVCRSRVDMQRAAAEVMTPGERNRRADEGYAPRLGGVEPAVVTFTTQVAATAVSELLERLIHYGPDPAPTEILLRLHEREISTNDQHPRKGHYCDPDVKTMGLGITEPFLGQTWPA